LKHSLKKIDYSISKQIVEALSQTAYSICKIFTKYLKDTFEYLKTCIEMLFKYFCDFRCMHNAQIMKLYRKYYEIL